MDNQHSDNIEKELSRPFRGNDLDIEYLFRELLLYCKHLEQRVKTLEEKNPVYGISFTENMKNEK
jgi:hypothetical protein